MQLSLKIPVNISLFATCSSVHFIVACKKICLLAGFLKQRHNECSCQQCHKRINKENPRCKETYILDLKKTSATQLRAHFIDLQEEHCKKQLSKDHYTKLTATFRLMYAFDSCATDSTTTEDSAAKY